MAAIDPALQGKDAKTRLQEWLQPRRHGLPAYTLREAAGQAHAQTFHVECRIDALDLTTNGRGPSRKAAEQMAAEAALAQLEGQGARGKKQGKSPASSGADHPVAPRAMKRQP